MFPQSQLVHYIFDLLNKCFSVWKPKRGGGSNIFFFIENKLHIKSIKVTDFVRFFQSNGYFQKLEGKCFF